MTRAMTRERAVLIGILVLAGAGWGLATPLVKIAVSEGYRHFGLIFWQLVISALLLGIVLVLRRRPLPLGAAQLRFYAVIALIGTVLPNSTSYEAARHLPAGVMAICIGLVPMFAFPIAVLMANEGFQWRKLAGLLCGLSGVLLLVAPEASLPERAMIAFIPLALVAPLFYGFEANFVAKWGTVGLDPMQVLCGASLAGAALCLPLALGTGQWIDPCPPYGAPDLALLGAPCIHGVVYTTYVWLVGRAGAVFTAQVSYLVTGFGILWAIVLLSESYSGWVWAALALMMMGLFLVQPRPSQAGPAT
jgi:drug/metabolite transporter (DMT)-like permease